MRPQSTANKVSFTADLFRTLILAHRKILVCPDRVEIEPITRDPEELQSIGQRKDKSFRKWSVKNHRGVALEAPSLGKTFQVAHRIPVLVGHQVHRPVIR